MQANAAGEIGALEAQATRAVQAGREVEAAAFWGRILEIEPRHERSLAGLGQLAFRKGDMEAARAAFQRLVEASGKDPQQWINLALACRGLRDEKGEECAIAGALAADPTDLVALILRGNLYERQARTHEAARAYGAAATVAPPMDQLHADLRPAVGHALAYRKRYDAECAAFLDQRLDPQLRDFAGEDLKRFRDSVDILVGRKRRYDSHSAIYHYPQLAPIEFLPRGDFPWLDAVEAATDQVRDEFLGVLDAEEGFTPYITYPDDVPKNQWAELNNSPRWSAFHLYKLGARVEENAVKCPATMELLAGVPQPDQPGRTPAAMFSLLKPRTRIPAHAGVTNVRLVTHLPLIVPPGCGFRVGNETREWVPGKAWVFDDTIEHEAWNDSDQLRVVLIFDIWHPALSAAERAMVTALAAALQEFAGAAAGFEP
jgi:aspartyl/asparaginyl beta-hydroxylase (cupin superfamily)/Flp pilus assembly protein TadD